MAIGPVARRYQDREVAPDLALPEMAATALLAHRERQAGDRAAAGLTWSGRDLVFSTRTGAALDAANVRREFRAVCKAAKIGK